MHKVLLVDDDEYIRLYLKRMKVWAEYPDYRIVAEAKNGQEALILLETQYFDLVITDIRMPKVNGIELTEKIVADGLASCVVFISEHSEFEYAKRGLILGAFDYLVKPIDEQDLRHLLDRVTNRLAEFEGQGGAMRRIIRSGIVTLAELALLKDDLIAGDMRWAEAARMIADKVLQFYGDDLVQAVVVLNSMVSDMVQGIKQEMPWIDNFIDINRALAVPVQDSSIQAARDSYCQSLQALSLSVTPYAPLKQYGPLVIKAQQYIMQHIDEAVTLSMLAEALFVNRTYLSELFKKKTGITLATYVSGMKVQRAKELLANENLTIAEIAGLLSFKDVEYFSRLFKQRTSCSPSDYRKQLIQSAGT